MTEPVPLDISERIDQALTDILGIHGPWVLAAEIYNSDSGEPFLATVWDPSSNKWMQLGMAHALVLDLESPMRQMYND